MASLLSPQLLLFVLVAAAHLEFSASQNVEKLLKTVSQLRNNKDVLVHQNLDYLDIVYSTQKALQNLWKLDIHERLQNLSLSSECVNSIEYVFADDSRLIPLVDATGKPGVGILDGNLNMMAAFDECFSYNYTAFCYSSSVEILGLKGADWKIGMCVPKYCTSEDIGALLQDEDIIPANDSLMCTDSKAPSYDTGAIVMSVICSLFAAMVITATVIDIFFQILNMEIGNSKSVNPGLKEKPDEVSRLIVPQNKPKPSRVNPLDFVMAFSLFKTVPTLLATKEGSGVITSLNGIRVISMSWVILGHTFGFAMTSTTMDNPLTIFSEVAPRLSFQAVTNAYFSVDSFFFLSGVLVAYLTLRETKKRGRFPFLHYYVHRYLRITPTYAFVIFFGTYLGTHLAPGPFTTLINPLREGCSKYWWTNLLYINNLYPWKLGDECMGWGWYLANDMQFYVIAPTMLIAAYYLLPLGIMIAGAFIASGFIINSVITGVFDFQANQFSGTAYQYAGNTNVTTYSDAIYTKPWDRISPYVVGLALGYVLYRNLKFDYNKVVNLVFYGFLWAVATFTAFWLVYGLYFTWHGHIPHKAENIIYIMLSRCLWACCLALLVYACHNGYGWVVNSFLSMKLWTPLARMTFNAYLIHPIVIYPVYGHLQVPIHYTDLTLACYFIAFLVLSYAAAGVLCVTVELPLSTVEMLLFKVIGVNRRGSQRQDTIKTKAAES